MSKKAHLKFVNLKCIHFSKNLSHPPLIKRPQMTMRQHNFASFQQHTVSTSNLDHTLECMNRQDTIMNTHRRFHFDPSEEFVEESEGIDEMKVRGINRGFFATKGINKPSIKGSLILRNQSNSSLFNESVASNRHPTTSRVNKNVQFSSQKAVKTTDEHRKQIDNNFIEETIFTLQCQTNSDAFYFEGEIDEKSKKIKKIVQIGNIFFQSDSEALSVMAKLLKNLHLNSRNDSKKPDLLMDGCWWVFSRNVIAKLKLEEFDNDLGEEDVDADEDRHNIIDTKNGMSLYSSREIKKKQVKDAFEHFSFTELYNVFVNKLDK